MENNVVNLQAAREQRARQSQLKGVENFSGRKLRPLVAPADRYPEALASCHLTETNCRKCLAPVLMVNGAYACDACGEAEFVVAFDTIDTR